jgi:Ca2+-binding EF-hand superfamily protein
LLGQDGYNAVLGDLKGGLSKFNGQKVDPFQLPDGTWVANVLDGQETMQVALDKKHYTVIPGRCSQPNSPTRRVAARKHTIALNNRSSVQVALESLCVEIQSAISRHSEETGKKCDLAKELKSFDNDTDGKVSKEELVIGCKRLGIEVNHQALDLMWPLFKPNLDTKAVCLDSFMNTIFQTLEAKKNVHLAQVLHEQTTNLSAAQRKKRIKQKSEQFRKLLETATMLQTLLLDLMSKTGTDSRGLFDKLDYDGGGSIDPEEFRGFLKFHKFDFTRNQVQLLWPMICSDNSGEMGFEAFQSFLKKNEHSGWNTRLMEDRFSQAMDSSAYDEMFEACATELVSKKDGSKPKKQTNPNSPKQAETQLDVMHRRLSIMLTPPQITRGLMLGGGALPPLPSSPTSSESGGQLAYWAETFPSVKAARRKSPPVPMTVSPAGRNTSFALSPRSLSSLPSMQTYPQPADFESFSVDSPIRSSAQGSMFSPWADVDTLNPNQRKIVNQGANLQRSFAKMQSVAQRVEDTSRQVRHTSDPGNWNPKVRTVSPQIANF